MSAKQALNLLLLLLLSSSSSIVAQDQQCSTGGRVTTTPGDLQNPCESHLKSTSLIISYENVTVLCGENKPLTHYSDKQQPPITYSLAETGKSYLLAMVDPNAPNSIGAYFLHWLVTDIEGEDFIAGQLGSNSRVLMDYRPPGPPPKTGVHAYQFFVLELSRSGLVIDAPSQRPKFDLVQFINANGLCTPIAATQFRTQAPVSA